MSFDLLTSRHRLLFLPSTRHVSFYSLGISALQRPVGEFQIYKVRVRVGASGAAMSLNTNVSVQYKDRVWEIELYSQANVARDASSIAFDLQAALNLSRVPVGLSLRVGPGADAVVCPLSVLIACPSYIATAFRGMSWVPLLEGGGEDDLLTTTTADQPPPVPPRDGETAARVFPPPPGSSPLKVTVPEPNVSMLVNCESTASPSEGWGRPLTAPPGDRTRGVPRPRPGRREGLGRPMSATPSDKFYGMRRIRPGRSESFGRPASAVPGDRSLSRSPAWGLSSPCGFRCEEHGEDYDCRSTTAPKYRDNWSSSMKDGGSLLSQDRSGHDEVLAKLLTHWRGIRGGFDGRAVGGDDGGNKAVVGHGEAVTSDVGERGEAGGGSNNTKWQMSRNGPGQG